LIGVLAYYYSHGFLDNKKTVKEGIDDFPVKRRFLWALFPYELRIFDTVFLFFRIKRSVVTSIVVCFISENSEGIFWFSVNDLG
jgi:hypothetical protein